MQRRLARIFVLPIAALLVAFAALPAGAASAKKTATEGVIVASDVPATFQSSPADPSSDKEVDKAAAAIPACKDYLATRKSLQKQAHAESRDFADATNDNLSNEVWVFPSTGAAKKTYVAMSGSTIAGCLQTLLQQQVASDPTTFKSPTVAIQQITALPAVGDERVGYTGGVQYTGTTGMVQTLLVSNLLVRVGPSIISYSFLGPGTASGYTTAFTNAVNAAIDSTVERMTDAVG